MPRILAAGVALAFGALLAAAPAQADQDETFFRNVSGRWTGPGQIVAGKYEGTKFVCDLAGKTPANAAGMELEGTCRVGLFGQPMSAKVIRTGKSYKGSFLDGAEGKGLDIISGNVDGDKIVVGLDRKQLSGAMIARLDGHDKMNITISVHVANQLVPVIGLSLTRSEGSVQQSSLN
ncbi:hypothetical protein [Consotaella salsifontis]|uniref:Uncharacterized protein n=1 Tax=Consotaella salsifontis TaxID=1365950 RepID=A0A1T4P977_9HYPH|nr:hypothetical protein [Consotaella salsifontis]SJZ87438.1 hypothetical protein SAMN05428963_103379 [Consotaella salsifontis]